jgi:type II secretory pathway predicted ATPase ExeA
MYYEHFGLKYPPFKITPDTQLFYAGGKRGLILNALIYAIESGEGIVKVVGEVGSGKTMLCRMLEKQLPKRIEVVYLANPHLPPEMVLHAIALEMRLPITKQSNRLQVMHALHKRLLEKHANKQQVVLFIEEAQGMPIETLEEIRLLSNLETSRSKLLQIVLFGQPELDTNLAAVHIRQLKERITHNFYLEALARENIQEYLHFRMHAVGYRGPSVFSSATIRLITQISQGLIRRINILADKALLAAFADDVHLIRPKHIRLAARDSGFSYPRLSISLWIILGFLMALIAGFGWFAFQDKFWAWKSHAPESTALTNEVRKNRETTQSLETVTQKKSVNQLEEVKKTNRPEELKIETLDVSTLSTVSPEIILQQRLQATEQWLVKTNLQHYTLQVMQIQVNETQNNQFTTFLSRTEIQPLLNNLYISQVKDRKGQVFWEITYGEFEHVKTAITTIANLPPILQRNKPFVRKIASLR